MFMRTCPKCGSPLKEGEMYCFNCGEKIASVTSYPEPREDFRIDEQEMTEDFGAQDRRQLPEDINIEREIGKYSDEYYSSENEIGNMERRPYPGRDTADPMREGLDTRFDRDMIPPERFNNQPNPRESDPNDLRFRQPAERPPQAFPPQMQNGQQAPYPPYPQQQQQPIYPPQMPPQQPQPEKKKGGFLSRMGKVLEILIYIIFIVAAIGAIMMLKNFADSVDWGLI